MTSTRAACIFVTAVMAFTPAGCATGGGSQDASNESADPFADPDADADSTADPVTDPVDEPVDDPEDDPAEDAADDPVDDPEDDESTDAGGDAGSDVPVDTGSDPTYPVIYCAVEPPTDCTAEPYGCCSSDRRIIYCVGGTDISAGCGSGLCGPDPRAPGYMNCI